MFSIRRLVTLLASIQVVLALEKDPLRRDDLCELNDHRMERVSTIRKLLDTFEAAVETKCRDEWLEPLRGMQQILDSSAGDACSLETINLIEEYHWHYVMGTFSRSGRKAPDEAIPEPLKMFFLHFVQTTTERCKVDVGGRLREAVSGATRDALTPVSEASLGALLDSLSIHLIPQSKIKGYSDFFFIYNAIINSEKKKGHLIGETSPGSITGEVNYMAVKLQDATKTRSIQERCKQQLYPIYSNTVLPIMKLVDLGFGYKSKYFASEPELLAEWYGNAQLCEFILPIKFYSSPSLDDGQIALVKDPEEIKQFEEQNPASEPEQASMGEVAIRSSQLGENELADYDDDHVVDEIKTNQRSRSRIYREALRSVPKTLKTTLNSKIKSMFVPKRAQPNNQLAEIADP